eukprot:176591-Chlamydomonas_euryale.AAC.3
MWGPTECGVWSGEMAVPSTMVSASSFSSSPNACSSMAWVWGQWGVGYGLARWLCRPLRHVPAPPAITCIRAPPSPACGGQWGAGCEVGGGRERSHRLGVRATGYECRVWRTLGCHF